MPMTRLLSGEKFVSSAIRSSRQEFYQRDDEDDKCVVLWYTSHRDSFWRPCIECVLYFYKNQAKILDPKIIYNCLSLTEIRWKTKWYSQNIKEVKWLNLTSDRRLTWVIGVEKSCCKRNISTSDTKRANAKDASYCLWWNWCWTDRKPAERKKKFRTIKN